MRPHRYWNDFTNVESELRDFIDTHGEPGVMPSQTTLQAAGQYGLLIGIRRHGGWAGVATRLGLTRPHAQRTARPLNYWQDFANLERELRMVVASHGVSGVMPNNAILEAAQRSDLIRAIRLHGGMAVVAERVRLSRPNAPRKKGYWQDFANLERELRAYIAAHGEPGVMPPYNELHAAGQISLADAILKHGGWPAVAARLGLVRRYAAKPPGYWDDFSNLECELRAYLAEQQLGNVMPTSTSLSAAGRDDLAGAILQHGGYIAVAARLGLTRPHAKKPKGYWQEFPNLDYELRIFMERSGIRNRIPTSRELADAGCVSIAHAILRHGGFAEVATRLGLAYIGPNTAARRGSAAAQMARALAPLAEARLLSSAHVLVLLRRTGLLTARDARIALLREGLIYDDHQLIAAAIRELLVAREIDPPLSIEPAADAAVDMERDEPDEEGAAQVAAADETNGVGAPPRREWLVLQGLARLDTLRLSLDEILRTLTTRMLWNAFYERLYAWYEGLDPARPITPRDVEAVVVQPYAAMIAPGLVADAIGAFVATIVEAVNLAAVLPAQGWCGPRLRLHQAEAVRQLVQTLRDERDDPFLLCADDPGMGKTIALLAAVCLADTHTTMIVAPKTVADDTWTREIGCCLPDAQIIRGLHTEPETLPGDGRVFIVAHYDELLDVAAVEAVTYPLDCLCLDEIHTIKRRTGRPEPLRRIATEQLRQRARVAIGMTGTPLINELAEPLSLIQTLSRHAPHFEYDRLSSQRMVDVADVFEALLPYIVRRSKAEMLLELPHYTIATVPVATPPAIEARICEIHAWPKAQAMAALIALRKLATEAKLPYLHERARQGTKLLILTYLSDAVSQAIFADLAAALPGQVGHIDGATSQAERQAVLDAFRRRDGIRVLVGTLGTIGVGLTLFDPLGDLTANEVIIADVPYTWAAFEQGIARLHREGQQQQVRVEVLKTTVTMALSDGTPLETIDERIWALISGKRELAAVVIDGRYSRRDSDAAPWRALHRWLDQARSVGVDAAG